VTLTSADRWDHAFATLLSIALAWGALSFGAVYPWAYQPLLAVLGVLGLWGLFGPTGFGRRRASGALAMGLALLVAAVALQLVPLSSQRLLAVSPATDAFLRQYDLAYAIAAPGGQAAAHSLSIAPARTRLGLLLLLGFSVFLLGLTRTLDGSKLRRLLPGIVILGVALAMIGIIQKPLFSGRIYGFWAPLARPGLSSDVNPFGPFVNRNHFAGWMLMALPLALGYLGGMITNGMRGIKPGWRARIVWLSSRDANQTALVGCAILLMGLSLVMTLSRSGITCFMIALAMSGVAVVRQQVGRSTRAIVVSYLLFVAILSAGWTGVDAILARFQGVDWTLEGRLFAWRDAQRIIRAFPWTGTGLNTYGIATLIYQTFQKDTVHFAEAHNDYLQYLAEGGLLLAIPTLVLVGLFAREVHRRFRERLDDGTGYWLRLGAVTGLVAIALQEIVEFSLQIPGNAALFVLLCGIAARRASGRRPRAPFLTVSEGA
jgi:O-antigen ligase